MLVQQLEASANNNGANNASQSSEGKARMDKAVVKLKDDLTWKCPWGVNAYGAITMTKDPTWKSCCRTTDGKESTTCKAHRSESDCNEDNECKWGAGSGLTGCDCSKKTMNSYAKYLKSVYPKYGIVPQPIT